MFEVQIETVADSYWSDAFGIDPITDYWLQSTQKIMRFNIEHVWKCLKYQHKIWNDGKVYSFITTKYVSF